MEKYYFMGMEFLYEVMKEFWRWVVVTVALHCEYLPHVTDLYTYKWLK